MTSESAKVNIESSDLKKTKKQLAPFYICKYIAGKRKRKMMTNI